MSTWIPAEHKSHRLAARWVSRTRWMVITLGICLGVVGCSMSTPDTINVTTGLRSTQVQPEGSGRQLYTSIWGENSQDWVFRQNLPRRNHAKDFGYGAITPWALAVDGSGNLFVSNLGNSQPTIVEFSATGSAVRTIRVGVQVSMMDIDSRGILYVMLKNQLAEYTPGKTKPTRTIQAYGALTIDRHDHLFADTKDGVEEFLPGDTTPIRTIANAGGDWLGVDSHGILYTTDYGSFNLYEYGPNSHGSVLRTIVPGEGSFAQGATLSPNDNLYLVAQFPEQYSNSVLVYAPGQTVPSRKIKPPANLSFGRTTALGDGGFLSVDSNENLYSVLNSGYDIRIAPSGKRTLLTSVCCAQMITLFP